MSDTENYFMDLESLRLDLEALLKLMNRIDDASETIAKLHYDMTMLNLAHDQIKNWHDDLLKRETGFRLMAEGLEYYAEFVKERQGL